MQGWLVYTLLSTAVTVSGIPFNLHDQVVAYVYPFKIAVAMIFVVSFYCCKLHNSPLLSSRWHAGKKYWEPLLLYDSQKLSDLDAKKKSSGE